MKALTLGAQVRLTNKIPQTTKTGHTHIFQEFLCYISQLHLSRFVHLWLCTVLHDFGFTCISHYQWTCVVTAHCITDCITFVFDMSTTSLGSILLHYVHYFALQLEMQWWFNCHNVCIVLHCFPFLHFGVHLFWEWVTLEKVSYKSGQYVINTYNNIL